MGVLNNLILNLNISVKLLRCPRCPQNTQSWQTYITVPKLLVEGKELSVAELAVENPVNVNGVASVLYALPVLLPINVIKRFV